MMTVSFGERVSLEQSWGNAHGENLIHKKSKKNVWGVENKIDDIGYGDRDRVIETKMMIFFIIMMRNQQ